LCQKPEFLYQKTEILCQKTEFFRQVANLASFGRLAKKRRFFPDFSSSRRQVGKNRRFCKTGTKPRFLQKPQFFVSVGYLKFFMF